MRPFAGLMLALVVAIASLSMTASRLQAAAVGEILLCTGDGAVLVSVDENGEPTGAPMICPECVLSHADAPEMAPLVSAVALRFAGAHVDVEPSVAAPDLYLLDLTARGPPAPV